MTEPAHIGSADAAAAVRIQLPVSGMGCASCVGRVERALRKTPGVLDVHVNLATEAAAVEYDALQVDRDAVRKAIEDAGYGVPDRAIAAAASVADVARERAARAEEHAAELNALKRQLLIASAFSTPLLLLGMIPMMHASWMHVLHRFAPETTWNWAFLALASVVQFGPGLRFYRLGWKGLRSGAPDMNALVMIGTTAAFLWSTVVTVAPALVPAVSRHVYFEASAVVITLVLLGRTFEQIARGRTSASIAKLVTLQPPTALRFEQGQAVEVPVESIAVGDILLVRPGERVPADGVVVDGTSWIDESMLTGEPVPASRGRGDRVIGGSVNGDGALRVTATHVGADTLLASIIRTVGEAQASKPQVQALADRVVAVFVPVILVVAALTFAAWWLLAPAAGIATALMHAVAVLIIACPCAMGLATPTSILVGTGRAAESGILFRRGDAIESLAHTTLVAFDKTGTLTEGRPRLVKIIAPGGHETELPGALVPDHATALAHVAAVEAASEHPLARAIVDGTRAAAIAFEPAREVTAIPGRGIEATVDGHRVAVGSDAWLRSIGVDLGGLEPRANAERALGRTVVFAAIDGALAMALVVADPVRTESVDALARLHALGIGTAMITGDAHPTARAVAAQVGIGQIRAEVLPTGKADEVRALRAATEHARIAFVGDGINDAPALAEADTGVAIGAGSDVAVETAQVVLLANGIRGVPAAIVIARATLRNIRWNLFWAFAYNVALIPIAAGVLVPIDDRLTLSPVMAGAAMSLSSVFVVANALRLRRLRV